MKRKGVSYKKRLAEVNAIYDRHARSGMSNREIWRRYIYPLYGISERTFYNMMNAGGRAQNEIDPDTRQLLLFAEEDMK